MARIFQRGHTWGIDYAVNGRRIRQLIGSNKALAELALKKKIVLVAENKHLDIKRSQKIKFKDFSDKYIQVYLIPNRPTWWKSEKHNIRHLNRFFGDRYLEEISSMDVEKFRQDRLVVVSKSSVNKNVGCLRAMFNKAIEWELFSGKNPASGVKFYKLDNKRLRFLEKEEIARLLGNCQGHLKDIIEFAINTGMRKGEIFNLMWRDIDMNNGMIYLLKTKNGDQRQIPINETVKNIFFRVRKNPDSPYVFNSFDGKPFNDIKKSFYTALEKSGIKEFRFHDLRHTFASQLVMSGVDLNTVRELLGHKSMAMTLRYAHLSCDHKKRAVKALDAINGTNLAHEDHLETLTDDLSNSYAALASGS